MAHNFDIDDFVWAKFLNYRPWPGRIKRQTILLKPGHLSVQFYGNDDYSQVLISNIYPYLDKVDEFTTNLPKFSGSCFVRAANTIHEKYWNSIDLKRESDDSGFPIDTDDEIEIAIEDRKAGHWNPRILRRPLPERRRRNNGNILGNGNADDNDDDDDDEEDYPDYPNPNWGRSTRSTRSIKKKKGAPTQVQNVATKTQNSVKTTGSKTETSCQASTSGLNSKASTSGLSNKASTSCQSKKASTSCQSKKASTSSQSNKASTYCKGRKASTSCQSSEEKTSCSKVTRSSVLLPAAKRQKTIQCLRSSTQVICENSEASTSKKTNTATVATRTRKSSQTLSLPEQKTSCEVSQPSTSKGINKVTTQAATRKGRSSRTITVTEQEVQPSTSTTSCINDPNSNAIAAETYSSPFQYLSLKALPGSEVPIPQDGCSGCRIKYGFLGLSSLSQSIIYPLVKGGHTVNIWSKDASKFNVLTKAGAVRTNTPARIITSSDVIFYCTRDPDITKSILFTREGVFDGCERSLGREKIFIELTNIDVVEPERSIRPLIKFQKGYYMQVKTIIPQIGNKASQIFICAGNEHVFTEVASCLYHVTRNIHYFGTEFFKDAPLNLTPQIVEELVLQSLQKTTSYLYDLGFHVPQFEKIVCHEDFEFGKLADKLKQCNEAKRKEKMVFYQDM